LVSGRRAFRVERGGRRVRGWESWGVGFGVLCMACGVQVVGCGTWGSGCQVSLGLGAMFWEWSSFLCVGLCQVWSLGCEVLESEFWGSGSLSTWFQVKGLG
jgi:hypothetical protein